MTGKAGPTKAELEIKVQDQGNEIATLQQDLKNSREDSNNLIQTRDKLLEEKLQFQEKNAELEETIRRIKDSGTTSVDGSSNLVEPLPSYPNYLDPSLVVFSVAAIRDRTNDYPYSEKEFDAVAESFAGQAVRLAQKIQAKVNEINSPTNTTPVEG